MPAPLKMALIFMTYKPFSHLSASVSINLANPSLPSKFYALLLVSSILSQGSMQRIITKFFNRTPHANFSRTALRYRNTFHYFY